MQIKYIIFRKYCDLNIWFVSTSVNDLKNLSQFFEYKMNLTETELIRRDSVSSSNWGRISKIQIKKKNMKVVLVLLSLVGLSFAVRNKIDGFSKINCSKLHSNFCFSGFRYSWPLASSVESFKTSMYGWIRCRGKIYRRK